jgi:hypothetical protein
MTDTFNIVGEIPSDPKYEFESVEIEIDDIKVGKEWYFNVLAVNDK